MALSSRNDLKIELSQLEKEYCEILNYMPPTVRMNNILKYIYPMVYKMVLKNPGSEPRMSGVKCLDQALDHRIEGNLEFSRGNYVDALKYYTKSIADSPADSKELPIAYANRSAVLFRLGRYTSSLVDINRALQNENYPSYMKQKLYDRKTSCITKIKSENSSKLTKLSDSVSKVSLEDTSTIRGFDEDATEMNFDSRFPLPTANFKNKKIPHASEKIKINFTQEMGRHLVATEDIEPGELLVVEKPYAYFLMPEFKFTHCSNCFIRTESLIPCNKCSLVMYCGERCREEAHNLYHRIECQILPIVNVSKLDDIELLTLRIFLIATKQGKELKYLQTHPNYGQPFSKKCVINLNNKFIPTDYFSIHNMEDHHEKLSVRECYQSAKKAGLLMHILSKSTVFDGIGVETQTALTKMKQFAGTLLLKYMHAQYTNAHQVSEQIEERSPTNTSITTKQIPIGGALCPLLCFMNHSCDPNAEWRWHKNYIVSYAIQPIAAGEQIFDYYGLIYYDVPLSKRQQVIKENYKYFKCQCTACKFEWPILENLPNTNPEYLSDDVNKEELELYSAHFKANRGKISEENFNFLCKYLSLMHKSIKKPWKEYAQCQNDIKIILSSRANSYKLSNDLLF